MNINFFDTVRKSEVTEALSKIIEGGYPRRELFLVTMLASGIATVGLIYDNVVLIIGSMIVAPLLLPLLSLGVGIAVFDFKIVRSSAQSILIGSVASILFVIPIALLLGGEFYRADDSYYSTIYPTVESSFVAIIAGIIAAFAISKEKLNDSMAGVAVAVALMPPLASIGIAISNLDGATMLDTGAQFLLNVALIALASAAVFRYLDFDQSITHIKKKVLKEKKAKKKEEK